MGDLKKADCVPVEIVMKEFDIVRNTLNTYMNVLSVPRHKFPFDKRVYITRVDFERLKEFVAENRGDYSQL